MSKVSRSVYQKLAEENKRLLTDIMVLCGSGLSYEKIEVLRKWRKKPSPTKTGSYITTI